METSEYLRGISVVLPNYNGTELLKQNLPPLIEALKASGANYEIIVSDDNSSDESIEFLAEAFPSVTVLCHAFNTGFASNCNRGITAARYAFCCVVNTDVTFTNNYFKHALEKLEDNNNAFSVTGPIHNYSDTLENVIYTETWCTASFERGFFRTRHPDRKVSHSTAFRITKLGCCFTARTSMLKKLGGYDERYSPFYWEDVELALHARAQGYDLLFSEGCEVFHAMSSTIPKYNKQSRIKFISQRNKYYLAWRYMKGPRQHLTHIFHQILLTPFRLLAGQWIPIAGLYAALAPKRENR